ncbi:NKD inhibitor of WNT signaling pathway naked cuticle [Megalopta genalis]|uniref:NKD inhibitor of WNT signaling pathway naked cuticle n=1 Tax=Megalopta genalis TaxID=115081 RepID=UPI001443817B|nr:protein naked cuticle homolog 1 [Megalopta genalis]XP_033334838.1 protein naked cuticle homolog 1 [Megalopta genalis]
MHEGLMATGLVKWWRARFLAGYRPFSVVGNTEGSDSEELLGGVSAPRSGSPPESKPILLETDAPQVAVDASTSPTPATGNDEQPSASTTKQLSFEEFECDVSVAEGDRRRQEFSFTLYDFDGHGKITKDDIAGLVTTIYDTLGASIQVPPCGSKTIKVKLTVSPDQRGSQTRTGCPNVSQPAASFSGNPSCCHLKHASCNNAATHTTAHGLRRVLRRRRAPRHRCQTEQKEVDSHSEDDGENARTNRIKQEELRRRVGPLPHLPSPYSNSSEGDISDDSDVSPAVSPLTPLLTTNQRKRSGALQRQQLLEIIQANMEKNNLSFHTSRKRHQNEQPRIPTQTAHVEPSTHYNQDCRSPSESRPTTMAYLKTAREKTQGFTSFSKVPAKTRGNLRKTRPQYGIPRNNGATQPPRAYVQPQVMSRTVISPTAYPEQQTTTNANRNVGNLLPNSQHPANQPPTSNHNVPRNETQFNQSQQCGKSSKKHQLKHATREQDQARAMVQVVRWLEREFSQNAAANSGRKHVHEHIHHHYHHYHTEALV